MRCLKSDIELFPADLADIRRSRMFFCINPRYLCNLRELYFHFKSSRYQKICGLGVPFIRKLTDFNIFNEQFRLKILIDKNRVTMAELKTTQNDADVKEFINSFADTEQKRKDSFELVKLMGDFTGFEPKMWGPSIIGFGSYHYKSERSRQEGDWPLVGFSPRKAAISLYVYTGTKEHEYLLEGLGKYKMGKACIYIRKLSDINLEALKKLMKETIDFLQSKYTTKS